VVSYYTFDRPDWRFPVEHGTWHGYQNVGDEPAYLLMYCSQKYDPSDEERMSEAEVPWG
jgi:dTDP-4-dehydrorhamnose 3,5-epimerase-like enzyme